MRQYYCYKIFNRCSYTIKAPAKIKSVQLLENPYNGDNLCHNIALIYYELTAAIYKIWRRELYQDSESSPTFGLVPAPLTCADGGDELGFTFCIWKSITDDAVVACR